MACLIVEMNRPKTAAAVLTIYDNDKNKVTQIETANADLTMTKVISCYYLEENEQDHDCSCRSNNDKRVIYWYMIKMICPGRE